MSAYCPVCDKRLADRVYQDQGDGYIEQVWLCDGDPGHGVVIEYGEPLVQEVRDGGDGERMPDYEGQFL